jgi:cellulose synthase/poly-beta-1,6-N-acetylglucosamine synthase-like glycosyltransferase
MMKPRLMIVIPVYNEEKVLPITAPMFLEELNLLIGKEMISEDSRVLFVNDGSRDKSWEMICDLAGQDPHYAGITLSRNRGHQKKKEHRKSDDVDPAFHIQPSFLVCPVNMTVQKECNR